MKLLQSMHALRSKHRLHLYGNIGCQVSKGGIQNYIAFWQKIKGNYFAESSTTGHDFKKINEVVICQMMS